jgi:hypothetical protein
MGSLLGGWRLEAYDSRFEVEVFGCSSSQKVFSCTRGDQDPRDYAHAFITFCHTTKHKKVNTHMTSATQEFKQKVCQKYGWSAQFDVDTNGRWFVDVTVGLNDTRRYVAETVIDGASTVPQQQSQPETDPKGNDNKSGTEGIKRQAKLGIEAASRVALQGLTGRIEHEESKPQKELCQVFHYVELPIYDSLDPKTWHYFWNHKPSMVGIDTEGNQQSPPVLIQIALDDYSILEVPQQGQISSNLYQLLRDPTITKTFCDSTNRDKLSLGIASSPQQDDSGVSSGDHHTTTTSSSSTYGRSTIGLDLPSSIVDLELLAAQVLGPVKVARGVARIATLSMPELAVSIQKPKQGKGSLQGRYSRINRYAMIEQGKAPPLNGLHELSHSP